MYAYDYDTTPTILKVTTKLKEFAETQASAVGSLASAVENVQTDKRKAAALASAGVNALVIADDAVRYTSLTRAAEGNGQQYNFTAVVAQWTDEDSRNREERKKLGDDWGTRQEVGAKVQQIQANIDIHDEALAKVSPEIGLFDKTSQAIREHNELYKDRPSVQITRENHDQWETFGGKPGVLGFLKGVWRATQWLFGFKGPFRAYKIMSKYNEKYGDFYEDATDIASLRENEKKLTADRASFQKEHDKYAGIASRMDTLDRTYKGPEGIANGIRGLVAQLVKSSDKFQDGLLSELPGEAAQNAVLGTIKVEHLTALEQKAQKQQAAASSTLEQLRAPLQYLANIPDAVKSESISFSSTNLANNVETAAKASRASARNVNEASDAVDEYRAPQGATREAMERKVQGLSNVNLENNQFLVDLSGVKTAVAAKVQAYEIEQERLRQIELERQRVARAKAEAEQKAIRDAFDAAARVAQRREQANNNTYTPSPTPSPSSEGFSVGNGSAGLNRDTGFTVGGGSRGLRR